MKITINDNRKIFAIQESFSEMFPFLKIEFFSKPNKSGGPSSKKFMRSSSKTIGECRTVHSNGTLTILPKMKVIDLEQGIRDTFGLSIQVFRKSGNAWLETTTTVDWTLDEQNRIGEEMSKPEVENEGNKVS
jgi:hypothetical protein